MRMHKLQGTAMACAVALVLVSVGCGGPSVVSEERETLSWIESKLGLVTVEGEHIVEVDLHGTDVNDADLTKLQSLSKLRSVVLYSTSISDAGLETLAELPSIKYIDISSTQVSPKTVSALTRKNSDLSIAGPGA